MFWARYPRHNIAGAVATTRSINTAAIPNLILLAIRTSLRYWMFDAKSCDLYHVTAICCLKRRGVAARLESDDGHATEQNLDRFLAILCGHIRCGSLFKQIDRSVFFSQKRISTSRIVENRGLHRSRWPGRGSATPRRDRDRRAATTRQGCNIHRQPPQIKSYYI